MITRDEFAEREILPILGDYATDFDVDGICDEVSKYDERDGYVWRPEYVGDLDALNDVLQRHDTSI